jgi:hypothetical protein
VTAAAPPSQPRQWTIATTVFVIGAAPLVIVDLWLLRWYSPLPWAGDYILAAPVAGLFLLVLFPPAFLRTVLGGVVFSLLFAMFDAYPRLLQVLILSWQAALIAGAVVGLAAGAGMYIRARAMQARQPILTGLAGLVFAGGWGSFAFLHLNAILDHAPPATFRVPIQSAEIRRHLRGPADHRITLAPWGPVSGSQGNNVSPDVYRDLTTQYEACVRLHPGAMGTPWYEIDRCPDAPPKV